jgi:hypothetical protein
LFRSHALVLRSANLKKGVDFTALQQACQQK